jgi:hypothetical protein
MAEWPFAEDPKPQRLCPQCGAANAENSGACFICGGNLSDTRPQVSAEDKSRYLSQCFFLLAAVLVVGLGLTIPAEGAFSFLYLFSVAPAVIVVAFILLAVRARWADRRPVLGVILILLWSGVTWVAMVIAILTICSAQHPF